MITSPRIPAFRKVIPLFLAAVAGGSSANATELEAQANVEHPGDVQHRVSLTFDPLLLIPIQDSNGIALSFLEVTGEVRLKDKLSVAGILGGGVATAPQTGAFPVTEIGGQFLGYPIGYFEHGLQLGGEIIGTNAATAVNGIAAASDGVMGGVLAGYKLATNMGFSVNVQGGVGYDFVVAQASQNGTSVTKTSNGVVPILRLNVGWSF